MQYIEQLSVSPEHVLAEVHVVERRAAGAEARGGSVEVLEGGEHAEIHREAGEQNSPLAVRVALDAETTEIIGHSGGGEEREARRGKALWIDAGPGVCVCACVCVCARHG